MPTRITDSDTKKIAGLIKLHLPDEKLPKYTQQLNTALDVMDVLKELDTEKVTETSQTHGLTNVLAEDEPQPGLNIDEYQNRKGMEKSYFVVGKVL